MKLACSMMMKTWNSKNVLKIMRLIYNHKAYKLCFLFIILITFDTSYPTSLGSVFNFHFGNSYSLFDKKKFFFDHFLINFYPKFNLVV